MRLTLDYGRTTPNATEVRRTKQFGFGSSEHRYSVLVTRDVYEGVQCHFQFEPPATGISLQPGVGIPAARLTLPDEVAKALANEILKHCDDKKRQPRRMEVEEHAKWKNGWKPRLRRSVFRARERNQAR